MDIKHFQTYKNMKIKTQNLNKHFTTDDTSTTTAQNNWLYYRSNKFAENLVMWPVSLQNRKHLNYIKMMTWTDTLLPQ